MSTALFQQSRCLNDSFLSDWPLVGLVPGQTYLAFTSNGFMIWEADRCSKYEILSKKKEAYVVVPDNSGTLQLHGCGDEVCDSYIRTAASSPMCVCSYTNTFV